MRKKFKKGFTLVELVVVIAIVAILGAVSTVGYFSFIEKANKSADEQLLTQINTTLKASETLDGKNETMHDAMIDLHESGVKDAELVDAKAKDLDFVWDKNSDRFALVNFNKKEVAFGDKESDITFDNVSNLWKVYDSIKLEDANYSAYLSEDTKINADDSIITNKGLDASSIKNPFKVTHIGNDTADLFVNENVEVNIDLSGSKMSLLNTNQQKLNIFGKSNTLNIKDSGNNTVHIYGEFKTINITKGNLSVEENAIAKSIYVFANDIENISLTVSEDAKTSIDKIFVINDSIKNSLNKNLNLDDSKLGLLSIQDRKLRFSNGKFLVVLPEGENDPYTYKLSISGNYGAQFNLIFDETSNDSTLNTIEKTTASPSLNDIEIKEKTRARFKGFTNSPYAGDPNYKAVSAAGGLKYTINIISQPGELKYPKSFKTNFLFSETFNIYLFYFERGSGMPDGVSNFDLDFNLYAYLDNECKVLVDSKKVL